MRLKCTRDSVINNRVMVDGGQQHNSKGTTSEISRMEMFNIPSIGADNHGAASSQLLSKNTGHEPREVLDNLFENSAG